jgi:hypothetical protein
MEPGLGYWMKTRGGIGYLRIDGTSRGIVSSNKNDIYATSAKVKITDANHDGTLYLAKANVNAESFELPPVPPTDMFDVRFTNNSNVTAGDAAIRIQGANYPVNVAVENSNVEYTVVNAATGEILGTAGKGSSVEISDKKIRTIKLLANSSEVIASDVAVSPNPAATVAQISYTMPEAGVATVKVFNALGQEVETLVNGFVAKGTQVLSFNTAMLPSGQYLVKFIAGETVIVRTITVSH